MREERRSSWALEEGDEIAPGRTALRLLGGGRTYEAYLAFDDHLHSVVVVKVLRPERVDDPKSHARLAAEADVIARPYRERTPRGKGWRRSIRRHERARREARERG